MAEETGGLLSGVKETVKTVVYALLIAGVFRTVFFQPFWIPSGSMKETLLIGDFLFVNKMAYGYSYASCPSIVIPQLGVDVGADDFCGVFKGADERLFGSEPEQGDIVVFRHPVTGRDFIKRLIGMPGDRVQMRDGNLYLNDVIVPSQPAGVFTETYEKQGRFGHEPSCNAAVGFGAACEKDRRIETLPNGVTYTTLDIGKRQLDDTGVFTVPEGEYFFMGDNRDNSTDSRVLQVNRGVGTVPLEDIVGRADRVVFSAAGRSMLAFWKWRSDRFFKGLE